MNVSTIDEELVTRLKRGDMIAFDKIYEHYSHKLFSFVFKILKNEADAEEIVQEVFVRIWESRHKLHDHNHVNSYLFTIAHNHSIDLIRKKTNEKKYLDHLKYASILSSTPCVIGKMEFDELNNKVDRLMASLPERQKQIFVLHREQGLTYSQIADKLGISVNTVENHMVRALKHLRKNLDNALLINMLFAYLFL